MTAPLSRRAALAAFAAALLAPRESAAAVAEDRVKRLARGFNLPDQAPLAPGKRPDRATLAWLRRRGMSHVRLPFLGEAAMARFAERDRIKTALDDLDRALDLLLDLDFAVSVDMHPGGDFQRLHRAEPDVAYDALAEAWRIIAARIARRPPERVFAELLNEPNVDDAIWREQAARLAAALRADLPATTLIAGPAPYQRVEALAAWRPLDDGNVVYAFHYYDPMLFTHQGMTWDPSDPLSRLAGVPYPARRGDPSIARLVETLKERGDTLLVDAFDRALARPWTKETIEAQFAPLAAWSRAHSAPVILNEFGVLRFKAPRAARLEWLRDVREAAEASGFGWAHWDYREGFGLLDEQGRPDRELIDALLPPRRAAAAGSRP
ncbi:MAG TPA: cellulase family glycosylhydrolase [Roseiarcus sp.]|nr:cellulase family glycosylhydrolase [Roseiarcus sp.]